MNSLSRVLLVISSVVVYHQTSAGEPQAGGACPAQPCDCSKSLLGGETVTVPKPRSSPFGRDAKHGMMYRPLGRTGLRVSAVSYGAWLTVSQKGQVSVEKAVAILREVVQQGINFIDNAESYGDFTGESEYMLGLALQQLYSEGIVERSDLVLSTKLWRGGDGVNDRGLSHKHLFEGLRKSLNRLQTDYVDIVYCHRPDPTTPLEETVRAMNRLLQRGMALYWGTSEWRADEIMEAVGIAQRLGLEGPVVEQPLYNLFNRQRVEQEYLRLYSTVGLGLTVYSPLAEGILAGRYNSETTEPPRDSRAATIARKSDLATRTGQIQAARAIVPLAQQANCSLSQFVLAWTLRHDRVSTAIMGASKPEQVRDNAGAVACLRNLKSSASFTDWAASVEAAAGSHVETSSIDAMVRDGMEWVGRGPHA